MSPTLSATQRQATWIIELDDEAATRSLAADVATLVGANDLVTLSGDLGAGKTTFARALIRILTADPELETPSPTFTLMQVYNAPHYPIVHADLYRIKSPDELAELGWDEASDGALVIVEWPDRAGDVLLADRLDVALYTEVGRGPETRTAVLTGTGAFAERLTRARAIHALLDRAGWANAKRSFMLGDASSRAYERLERPDGSKAILMISPPRPDGPPVRYGKPYSAIARLAENITPFIAIGKGLADHGFSTPDIFAYDLDTGLAVLEDLGTDGVVANGAIIVDRYAQSAATLAQLHQLELPHQLVVDETIPYTIPPYDMDALLIEVELLTDWYVPHIARHNLSSGAKANFVALWKEVLGEIVTAKPTWVLRDYHSPNIIWLEERAGLNKVGIIDYQDCVMGHPAYDLASLLQDARIDVPDDVELKLLGAYARLRREADPAFNMADFARAYAILGAQRATKILGIFARLDKRDHKPHYLAHLPRVEHYLRKGLAHPALADLKGWYAEHLPRLLGV